MIQPHSDDLLFSCAHLLLSDEYEDYDKQVLTVENNLKRVKEDEALYSMLNIPYTHLTVDFDDQSYYGYHKKYREVTIEDSYCYLSEFFSSDILADIKQQLKDFIVKYLKKNNKDEVIVVAPWGIGHPFHLFVRDCIENILSSFEVTKLFYREFPHSYKKRSRVQVEKQQQEYTLLYSKSVSDFEDVKWMLAKKIYKTQSSLLFFESGYINKHLDEEIYTN